MANLFDRANSIGLMHIREWLPNGRQESGEWVALNPTREDRNAGSFKVNLKTGKWIDNASGESGGDAVSLYCYLNRADCLSASQAHGYKNTEGGAQAEAARMILERHDPSYFPSESDDFAPSRHEQKATGWDGFSYRRHAMSDDLPDMDLSWFEDKWGKEVEHWDFVVPEWKQRCRFVMRIVRFMDGKKKSDRPFTLWQKGDETRWRAKAPEETYPLWNLPKLVDDEHVNLPVIICEGQKAASRGDASDIKGYVFTGWYGGAAHPDLTDWKPLAGRTCYFWPDSDVPGRKAIYALRKIEEQYDLKLTVIHPPTGKEKGWDLADALASGEDIEKIINPQKEDGDDPQYFLDDDIPNMPFKIIGTSGSDIIFYPNGSNRIERYRASSLTKNALMTLAPREWWGKYYMKGEGGIAWDSAINDLIRWSEKAPVFDWSRVRGAGAWYDDGDIVINTGNALLINGERKNLHERVGQYVYEKQSTIPYRTDDPLSTENSTHLLECLKSIRWKNTASPYAVAGWLTLAPWGGLLRWRPHIWIVGPKGTGKSWIMEHIINPVSIKLFGVKGDGDSTPAGVRQWLHNSSRCFMGDEMESDSRFKADSIDQILSLFRGSSSGQGSGGVTLQGSADGEGKQWIMQSMACFASIGAAMNHGADIDRFTICELAPPIQGEIENRKRDFAHTQKLAREFTDQWSMAYHARVYSLIPQIMTAITVMCEQASNIMGSMRDGDQIGTLMAGCWMSCHDTAPTAAEASAYLKAIRIEDLKSYGEIKTDEEQCLDEILSTQVEIVTMTGRRRLTVGSALDLWYDFECGAQKTYMDSPEQYPAFSQKIISAAVEMLGLKPMYDKGECYLYIAIGSVQIRKALQSSGWGSTYVNLLERLPSYKGVGGPTMIGGTKKRFLKMLMREDSIPF